MRQKADYSQSTIPTVTPYRKVSGAQDVVDLERLVDLAEPLGAAGRAATSALVERQLQLAQQAGDFLARRHMAHVRAGAERCLVEVVQRGQAAGKEFAVNDPFGEAVDRTEAEPERQLVESVGDQLLVARSKHRQPVAHDDPVGTGAIDLPALAPGVAHHLRIMALAGDRIVLWV